MALGLSLGVLAVVAPGGAGATVTTSPGFTFAPTVAPSMIVEPPSVVGPPSIVAASAVRQGGVAVQWPAAAPSDPSAPFQASVVRQRLPPDHFTRPPDRPYRSFTLSATGDLLIHTPVRTRAATPDGGFDFAPQLAGAVPDVAGADLGLCHLEVPLDPVGPYSSYPIFNAPAQLADGIAATGWDVCSTASNHSADKGFDGLVRTLDALDAAGVGHRGMFRSQGDALVPRLQPVGDVAVGLLSATYGLNGLPAPGGHEWSVQRIDVPALLDRGRELRAAGADVVVISLHWGNEYQHAPSAAQRTTAEELMAGGEVDAIIGHHAHVVQPVEWIAHRPVVYGLGNFLSGQRPTERRDGAVVTLEFAESATGWWVDAVHAQPTWVDDSYEVVTADPDQGGVLGASAQRTLGYLGVSLSPPPPPPRLPATHFER